VIIIVYGTTGELIKLLPLIKSIPDDQQLRINTSQQPQQLQQLMKDADLPTPQIALGNGVQGHDLDKPTDLIRWGITVTIGYIRNYRNIRAFLRQPGRHAFVVHGDTVTTVLGALVGRLHRKPVMHIEAGLRSYNWRHPFPEELDRMIVSKLARYHFSPGAIPITNLHKAHAKGEIIDTKRNTVLDSLRMAKAAPIKPSEIPADLSQPYYVVSIHRNELMSDEGALQGLLEIIQQHSERAKIRAIFLDHPITKERIKQLGYDHYLAGKNITRLPKLSYYRFIQLVSKAKYIVTDSGGLQEEAAYLDIPCLVHRMATERQEGLGQNVVLSVYDRGKVEAFLKNPEQYRGKKAEATIRPTQIIVDKLYSDGFIEK